MCERRGIHKYFLIGNAFFLPAMAWDLLMRHAHLVSDDRGDAVRGLFYGFTFGFYILGLIKVRREQADREAR